MKFKKLLWTTALLMVSPALLAKTPSVESVNKLIDLMQIEQQLQSVNTTTNKQMADRQVKRWMALNIKEHSITAQQEQQLHKILSVLVQDMTRELVSSDKFKQDLRHIVQNAYQQVYTQQEVDAIYAFLSTEEGQSMMKKQPFLVEKIVPNMLQLIEEDMIKNAPKYKQRLQTELKKIKL